MIITVDSKGEKTYHWLLEAVMGCQENELKKSIETRAPIISLVGGGGKTTCVMAISGNAWIRCFRIPGWSNTNPVRLEHSS